MTVTVYVPMDALGSVRHSVQPPPRVLDQPDMPHSVGWLPRMPEPDSTVLSEGKGVRGHQYVAVQLSPEEFDRLRMWGPRSKQDPPPGTRVVCRDVYYTLGAGPDADGMYDLHQRGVSIPFRCSYRTTCP